MVTLKITTVGNSVGLILPKQVLEHLKVGKGDQVFLVETPGGYLISAHDPDFEKMMHAGEETMQQYRNALKELAKK